MTFFGKIFPSDLKSLHKMSAGQIRVFLSLAIHANDKRQTWISVQTISNESYLSYSGSQKALKKLESAGLITVQRRGQKTNMYTLQSDTDYTGYDTDCTVSNKPQSVTDFTQSDTPSTVSTNRSIGTDQSILSRDKKSEDLLFDLLVEKWSKHKITKWNLLGADKHWKSIKKEIQSANPELDIGLELQLIDAWLMKELDKGSGKVWTNKIWPVKITTWLKRQSPRSEWPASSSGYYGRTITLSPAPVPVAVPVPAPVAVAVPAPDPVPAPVADRISIDQISGMSESQRSHVWDSRPDLRYLMEIYGLYTPKSL